MKNIIKGDCIEEMKKLKENSVDAIITDPPYGIGFMGKEWDNFKPKKINKTKKLIYKTDYVNGIPVKRKKPELVTRDSSARVSGTYDLSLTGNQKFQKWFEEVAKECLRIIKPGGYLLVFGGTRTYHRLVCGIEDAGFEIRDCIMWLYGSGFPKSLNIGKQVDKVKGNERNVIGEKVRGNVQKAKEKGAGYLSDPANRNNVKQFGYGTETLTKGSSEWEGWGTALKPACEPIVVARKPLSEKNVALNVLKWGTGGINIDDCRIGTGSGDITKVKYPNIKGDNFNQGHKSYEQSGKVEYEIKDQGRFPANIILDEEAGKVLDEQTGELKSGSGAIKKATSKGYQGNDYGKESRPEGTKMISHNDSGGASRFFYCAKASKRERNLGCEEIEPKLRSENNKIMGDPGSFKTGSGNERNGFNKNNHPTVKPIKLMEYLIKLVSKEGAVVLDPFLGSGTTLLACQRLNRKGIGIEREEDYIKIAQARLKKIKMAKTYSKRVRR